MNFLILNLPTSSRIGRHRASSFSTARFASALSRFAAEEAGRLLTAMGASVQTFNPSGLPLPDDAPESHPKVVELRERVRWCDGMIWSSPERHGAMSAVMKAQIDWIP